MGTSLCARTSECRCTKTFRAQCALKIICLRHTGHGNCVCVGSSALSHCERVRGQQELQKEATMTTKGQQGRWLGTMRDQQSQDL